MAQNESQKVRLKVSPEVAKIVKPGTPRDSQLAAAQGTLSFKGKDLLTVLFFLCHSRDALIKSDALKTLRKIPQPNLVETLKDKTLHPQLIELVAKARLADFDTISSILSHPATELSTVLFLARNAGPKVLDSLVDDHNFSAVQIQIKEAVFSNPQAGVELKSRLSQLSNPPLNGQRAISSQDEVEEESPENQDDEGRSQEEIEQFIDAAGRDGLSKYQIALELKVAEKIKLGFTGDKEWRSLMIKQPNKLIQGAVLKNPRITDGEVLMVANNKSSSEDLVRAILINKDWMKNYDIKKALATHPKTPLAKAIRLVPTLTTKDIKQLAKSRQVSTIVSTAARKEFELRKKKMGG